MTPLARARADAAARIRYPPDPNPGCYGDTSAGKLPYPETGDGHVLLVRALIARRSLRVLARARSRGHATVQAWAHATRPLRDAERATIEALARDWLGDSRTYRILKS